MVDDVEKKVDALIARDTTIDKEYEESKKRLAEQHKWALFVSIVFAVVFAFVVGVMVGYHFGYEQAMCDTVQKMVFTSFGLK